MLAEMLPEELGEWFALRGISPYGEERDDLRAAQIAYYVASAGLKKQSGESWKLDDFMMFSEKTKESADNDLSRKLRASLVNMDKSKRKA